MVPQAWRSGTDKQEVSVMQIENPIQDSVIRQRFPFLAELYDGHDLPPDIQFTSADLDTLSIKLDHRSIWRAVTPQAIVYLGSSERETVGTRCAEFCSEEPSWLLHSTGVCLRVYRVAEGLLAEWLNAQVQAAEADLDRELSQAGIQD